MQDSTHFITEYNGNFSKINLRTTLTLTVLNYSDLFYLPVATYFFIFVSTNIFFKSDIRNN